MDPKKESQGGLGVADKKYLLSQEQHGEMDP